MSRKKVTQSLKKIKVGYSITFDINEILNKYLTDNYLYNKSNYIESLIIKDLKEKGIIQ